MRALAQATICSRAVTMAQLTQGFSGVYQRPVIDNTGLPRAIRQACCSPRNLGGPFVAFETLSGAGRDHLVAIDRDTGAAGDRIEAGEAAVEMLVIEGMSVRRTTEPDGQRKLAWYLPAPRPITGGRRASHVASEIAIIMSVVFVVGASAHHSFAPHFDSSKPVGISGPSPSTRGAIRATTSISPRPTRTAGRASTLCESHGVTQLTQGDRPTCSGGHEGARDGVAIAAQPYMCFFDTSSSPAAPR